MQPKIYAATEDAAIKQPSVPLDGTLSAAQAYVDRITTSYWWKHHCPPNFHGTTPTKVVCQFEDSEDMGGAIWVEDYYYRGRLVPLMILGPNPTYNDLPAIADPWLILHELAHVWEYNEWHGKQFISAFIELVKKYQGIDHARSLVDAMKNHKVRIRYRDLGWWATPGLLGQRS